MPEMMPPQGPRPPQANGPMPMGAEGMPPMPEPMPSQEMPPEPPVGSPSSYDQTKDPTIRALTKALHQANLADGLDEEELQKIGEWARRGYEADRGSRAEWEQDYQKHLEQAMQVVNVKTFPWPGASNVKFPIISIAAMQFAARAYPTLVPSDNQVVRQRVIGNDMEGAKARRAEQLGLFMSWQVMSYMRGWEADMDKLLIMLPIVGTVFKKTYWDFERECPKSMLVDARDLVVNFWARDLESAERKTHLMPFPKRLVQEKINAGLFLDVLEKLGEPGTSELRSTDSITKTFAPETNGPDTPFLFGEMHTYYDVDGDDYPEPVIITFDTVTGIVLRIAARYEADDVKVNAKDELVRIDANEHFVKYGMFPNPSGGFYDVGFGVVLGPINDSVDTIINQLIDAGTLSNLQGGWMSKGLKVKQGDMPFKPGEWRQVNATLDDLRKGVLPHQYKEPSAVLFQLLGMLTHTARELASVSELMTGKLPGQNTPAYTTRETAEQGMKVFTACYKRIFNSMTTEFRRLYYLNKIHLDPQELVRILDAPDAANIFEVDEDDVIPAADPQAMSAASKSQKAQQFMQLLQLGAINREAGLRKILEYEEVPLTPELMAPPPPPPPDPKVEMEQQKFVVEMQMQQREHQFKIQSLQQEHTLKMKELEAELQMKQEELQLERQKMLMELEAAKVKLGIEREKIMIGAEKTKLDMEMNRQATTNKLTLSQQEHQNKLKQQEESHSQSMKQLKEKTAAKRKKHVARERDDGSLEITEED